MGHKSNRKKVLKEVREILLKQAQDRVEKIIDGVRAEKKENPHSGMMH